MPRETPDDLPYNARVAAKKSNVSQQTAAKILAYVRSRRVFESEMSRHPIITRAASIAADGISGFLGSAYDESGPTTAMTSALAMALLQRKLLIQGKAYELALGGKEWRARLAAIDETITTTLAGALVGAGFGRETRVANAIFGLVGGIVGLGYGAAESRDELRLGRAARRHLLGSN